MEENEKRTRPGHGQYLDSCFCCPWPPASAGQVFVGNLQAIASASEEQERYLLEIHQRLEGHRWTAGRIQIRVGLEAHAVHAVFLILNVFTNLWFPSLSLAKGAAVFFSFLPACRPERTSLERPCTSRDTRRPTSGSQSKEGIVTSLEVRPSRAWSRGLEASKKSALLSRPAGRVLSFILIPWPWRPRASLKARGTRSWPDIGGETLGASLAPEEMSGGRRPKPRSRAVAQRVPFSPSWN